MEIIEYKYLKIKLEYSTWVNVPSNSLWLVWNDIYTHDKHVHACIFYFNKPRKYVVSVQM